MKIFTQMLLLTLVSASLAHANSPNLISKNEVIVNKHIADYTFSVSNGFIVDNQGEKLLSYEKLEVFVEASACKDIQYASCRSQTSEANDLSKQLSKYGYGTLTDLADLITRDRDFVNKPNLYEGGLEYMQIN